MLQTPYYLIDKAKLLPNMETIARLREASGAKSLLALKCFAAWSVFDFMAHEPIREGRLVEVLHPFAAPGPEVFALVLPQQAKAPKVRAFLDFATEALGTGR